MGRFINYRVGKLLSFIILISGCALSQQFDDYNIMMIIMMISLILYFIVDFVFMRCPYCRKHLSKRDRRRKQCRHCDAVF